MSNLREKFEHAIRAAIKESYEIGYPPTRFEQMIAESHPVEVAKRLVRSGVFQDGFRTVVSMGRSDITVEAIMLREEFTDLFTPDELEAARWRLKNVGTN